MSSQLVDLSTGEQAGSGADKDALARQNGYAGGAQQRQQAMQNQPYGTAGVQNSGNRVVNPSLVGDDQVSNQKFWMGSATPGYMQTQVGPAAQSQGINGLNQQAQGLNSGLAAQLWAQAQGKGPSLAQMQLQQGTDQNLRQQAALAASGRNPASASYNAMQNQAGAAQTMAGQSAMARLQEQYQAQQGLAGLTGQMNQASLANANMGLANNQFNAAAQNQNTLAQAQLNANSNQFYNSMMAGQQGQYNAYQNASALQKQGADQALRNGLVTQIPQMATQAATSGGPSAVGGAAALSDERQKTDIEDGGSSVQSFLDRLKAHEYAYKNPSAPGAAPGRHVSVMAQELEKAGPVGKSMVDETPNGKMVSYSRGLATMLAAQANLHERLKKLEGK